MGSALLNPPIIAPTNFDRHQILRNFCHESVRKGLRAAPFRLSTVRDTRFFLAGSRVPAESLRTVSPCQRARPLNHSQLGASGCKTVYGNAMNVGGRNC
jgi:hypothetical protein